MSCSCAEARQLTRLREWIQAEIRDWKHANAQHRHGLTEFGMGTLETLQTVLVMSYDPEELAKKMEGR